MELMTALRLRWRRPAPTMDSGVSGSVQDAHLVVVGDGGGEPGVAEGRAGEVVAADLLPAGFRVPPGPEFVACGAGYGCPAQLDGAFCGLCAQFRELRGWMAAEFAGRRRGSVCDRMNDDGQKERRDGGYKLDGGMEPCLGLCHRVVREAQPMELVVA